MPIFDVHVTRVTTYRVVAEDGDDAQDIVFAGDTVPEVFDEETTDAVSVYVAE